MHHAGQITGGLTFYRYTTAAAKRRAGFDTGDYDYAFQLQLTEPKFGPSYFLFNTNQPSRNPRDSNIPITQWLTLVNLGIQPASFHVTSRFDDGSLFGDNPVTLNPFQRIDLDGGHGAGAGKLGGHIIEPENASVPYLPVLIRYGSTFDPERFAFAIPFTANSGSLRLTTGGSAESWIETGNLGPQQAGVELTVDNVTGSPLVVINGRRLETSFVLPGYAHRHIRVEDYLSAEAGGGSAQISATQGPVLSQAITYYFDARTGSIATAFGTSGQNRPSSPSHVSYNRYLGMYNWLRVSSDAFGIPTPFSLKVGSSAPTAQMIIYGGNAYDFDIHNASRFATSPDTYGIVQIDSVGSFPVIADMLRIRPTRTGLFDFVLRTEAR